MSVRENHIYSSRHQRTPIIIFNNFSSIMRSDSNFQSLTRFLHIATNSAALFSSSKNKHAPFFFFLTKSVIRVRDVYPSIAPSPWYASTRILFFLSSPQTAIFHTFSLPFGTAASVEFLQKTHSRWYTSTTSYIIAYTLFLWPTRTHTRLVIPIATLHRAHPRTPDVFNNEVKDYQKDGDFLKNTIFFFLLSDYVKNKGE